MKEVIAAGGLVVNEFNEILFIYRHSKWDLPKGHWEKGESIESCALREVKEETGLKDVSITRFIGKTVHNYFDNYRNAEAVKETHWFEMHASKSQEFYPQTEEDIEWIKWVSPAGVHLYLKNSYQNIAEILEKSGLIPSY